MVHEVVLDARCHKTVACQRCFVLDAGVEADDVVVVGSELDSESSSSGEELRHAALSVGIFGGASILHETFAFDGCSFHISFGVEGEDVLRVLILTKGACLHDIYIIIVSELVSDSDFGVRIAEVVLDFRRVGSVVILCELVHVGVACAAEEVRHGFVVHALREVEGGADGVFVFFVDVSTQHAVEGCHHLVVVATLLVVECFSACRFVLSVDEIHSVPVDLTVGVVCHPVVFQRVVLLEEPGVLCEVVRIVDGRVIDVEDGGGEVFVVVGSRVVGVSVPAECGGTVPRVLKSGSRGPFRFFVDVPVPGEDGGRFEVVDDA